MIEESVLRNILELQAQQAKDYKTKQVLKMEKVGLCGIPSLWMNKDELVKE